MVLQWWFKILGNFMTMLYDFKKQWVSSFATVCIIRFNLLNKGER